MLFILGVYLRCGEKNHGHKDGGHAGQPRGGKPLMKQEYSHEYGNHRVHSGVRGDLGHGYVLQQVDKG
jgi:hypothetical protein